MLKKIIFFVMLIFSLSAVSDDETMTYICPTENVFGDPLLFGMSDVEMQRVRSGFIGYVMDIYSFPIPFVPTVYMARLIEQNQDTVKVEINAGLEGIVESECRSLEN
jgi:hypothetical protein